MLCEQDEKIIQSGGAMPTIHTIRKVPWTCRWGRFGGPVTEAGTVAPGFLFWVCGHPTAGAPKLLGRDTCEACAWWAPLDEAGARDQ